MQIQISKQIFILSGLSPTFHKNRKTKSSKIFYKQLFKTAVRGHVDGGGQILHQNSQPASLNFCRMKKNQSFKVSLNAGLENIEIISDFKTTTMQNPPQPPKVNLRYGELKLNKNIQSQNI